MSDSDEEPAPSHHLRDLATIPHSVLLGIIGAPGGVGAAGLGPIDGDAMFDLVVGSATRAVDKGRRTRDAVRLSGGRARA